MRYSDMNTVFTKFVSKDNDMAIFEGNHELINNFFECVRVILHLIVGQFHKFIGNIIFISSIESNIKQNMLNGTRSLLLNSIFADPLNKFLIDIDQNIKFFAEKFGNIRLEKFSHEEYFKNYPREFEISNIVTLIKNSHSCDSFHSTLKDLSLKFSKVSSSSPNPFLQRDVDTLKFQNQCLSFLTGDKSESDISEFKREITGYFSLQNKYKFIYYKNLSYLEILGYDDLRKIITDLIRALEV